MYFGPGFGDGLNGWLLDGHNRVEICQRRNIPFREAAVKLNDENEAMIWILQNQLGQRNVQPYDRGVLALKLQPLLEAQAKIGYAARQARQAKSSDPSLHNCAKIVKCLKCGNYYDGGKWDASKNAGVACPYCFNRQNTQKSIAVLARVSEDTIAKVKKIETRARQKQ